MKSEEPNRIPLQLQAYIKTQRTNAIIMAVICIISIYLIPWGVFYIILATKLDPKKVPSKKLIKGAAIATLPLCLSVIPLLVDIEFWKMNKRLKQYEEEGSKAFMSDEQYIAEAPKRKRRSIILWAVLLSFVALLIISIAILVVSTNSDSTSSSSSILESEAIAPYTSSEHGFTVSFPGFPTTEHATIDVQGISVPYTYYAKETDNGNKVYAVQVVKYPTSGFNLSGQERGSLDGAINGMAQDAGSTIVESSNNGTFLGYPSAEATIKVNDNGDVYDTYAKAFIKGNDLFLIYVAGVSKESFNSFVDSYKFN